MSAGQLQKAAEDTAYGLTSLAGAYGLLFEFRTPGQRNDNRGRPAPQSRPPLSVHVIDTIDQVEQLATWAEATVAYWLGEDYYPYLPWWQGEPCPLIPESLTYAARRLPDAAPHAGHAIYELADHVTRTLTDVKGIIGVQGPADLVNKPCPHCHTMTLVRLPDRTLCAVPACNYELRNTR